MRDGVHVLFHPVDTILKPAIEIEIAIWQFDNFNANLRQIPDSTATGHVTAKGSFPLSQRSQTHENSAPILLESLQWSAQKYLFSIGCFEQPIPNMSSHPVAEKAWLLYIVNGTLKGKLKCRTLNIPKTAAIENQCQALPREHKKQDRKH